MFAEVGVQRSAIDRVSARRIAAVGPVKEPIFRSSSRSIGSGKPSNSASMSVRFAAVSPFGMSIFARKMRPLPAFAGPFCVQ